jgi:hypothetical protein
MPRAERLSFGIALNKSTTLRDLYGSAGHYFSQAASTRIWLKGYEEEVLENLWGL